MSTDTEIGMFMGDCKVKKGEPFTHVTKSAESKKYGRWNSGSFYIGEEYIEHFQIYVCNNVKKKKYMTIAEKPGPVAPLRIDLDFKWALDKGTDRIYTYQEIASVIKVYQEEILSIIDEEYLDEDEKNKILWCMVLEKSAPRLENGFVKDGLHIHFPHFICEGWIQDRLLRDRVMIRIIEEDLLNISKYLTGIDDILDKNMAPKVWMMYGSMNYKGESSEPYLYLRPDSNGDGISQGIAFDHKQEEISLTKLFKDEMIGRKNSVRYYLPILLSIRGYVEATKLTEDIRKKKNGLLTKKKKKLIMKKRRIEDSLADIKIIKDGDIMDMISSDRADNYGDWMDVGWALFCIGQGCEEALELWKEFSKKSDQYIEGDCEELWSRMDIKDKTIGSLLYMAKNDSPQLFNEWKATNVNFWLWKSVRPVIPNEYDVAMVVCKLYGDKFVCADPKKDIWYEYENHRWNEMNGNIPLKKLLCTKIVDAYYQFKTEVTQAQANAEDSVRDKFKTYLKTIEAIISGLKSCNFSEKVVKMCKLELYDKTFLAKIDENKTLLGCENGVIDLDLQIFREGRPDDYVTFSTGQYFKTFHEDDEEVKELDDFLMKVFPNPHLREYFLDFMCSCMQGGNVHKRFLVNTGDGDNGKSITFILLELTFGSGDTGYTGKFPRQCMIIGKDGGGSAPRPELARVRGKRIMIAQEVAKTEKLNIGFIKEVTGSDSIFVRSIFEKGTEIKPMFTLCMQCNEVPEIPGHDEATWSRVRQLDYESKFVKPQDRKKYPVPKTLKEQMKMKRFPADPLFSETLPELSQVLLWKLFERFKSYKLTGLREPDEVVTATNIYKANNDVYLEFIKDKIEKVNKPDIKTDYIRRVDMLSEFRDWYKENYPSYKKEEISSNKLKHELNKRLGMIKNKDDIYGFGNKNRWYGYRIVEEDADEEGDVMETVRMLPKK